MTYPTAWIADVPDAFLAVFETAEGFRWRFLGAGATTRVATGVCPKVQGAKSAAAATYRARVGQPAVERVTWSACTSEQAQAHGLEEHEQAQVRRVSAHVAECVSRTRDLRDEVAARRSRPAPLAPEIARPERPAVPLAHFLDLLCGEVPAEDKGYLAFIHTVPSVVSGAPCEIAHHEPPKGMGGANDCDYNATPVTSRESEIRHGTVHPKKGEPTAQDIERICLAARLPLVLAYFAGPQGPGRSRNR